MISWCLVHWVLIYIFLVQVLLVLLYLPFSEQDYWPEIRLKMQFCSRAFMMSFWIWLLPTLKCFLCLRLSQLVSVAKYFKDFWWLSFWRRVETRKTGLCDLPHYLRHAFVPLKSTRPQEGSFMFRLTAFKWWMNRFTFP